MTMRVQCKECEEWLDLFSVKSHVCKSRIPSVEEITDILETIGVDPTNHSYRVIATMAWTRGRKVK